MIDGAVFVLLKIHAPVFIGGTVRKRTEHFQNKHKIAKNRGTPPNRKELGEECEII